MKFDENKIPIERNDAEKQEELYEEHIEEEEEEKIEKIIDEKRTRENRYFRVRRMNNDDSDDI